jgi:hypothetical protein
MQEDVAMIVTEDELNPAGDGDFTFRLFRVFPWMIAENKKTVC